MIRSKSHRVIRRLLVASGLTVPGLPLLALGCAESAASSQLVVPHAVVRAAGPVDQPKASRPAAARSLPISLDTVLRLAEEQNGQIALARERVLEATAEKNVKHWLPDVYVGTAYYRHEGGIQNEDGTLTHSSMGALFAGLELDSRLDVRDIAYRQVTAERKAWQQQGELSKITSETLLDAAGTYIDLLAARTGEAVARNLEKHLQDLLEYTGRVAKVEPGLEIELVRIRAELNGRRYNSAKLREQAAAASAKLVYLLGLDPAIELLPVDSTIVPIDLVDANVPVNDLIDQSLANGPGIREMEGILNLIQESLDKASGPGRFLPTFEVCMAEGAFGAGPGDRMDWDNRWDLGLRARWNLTELASLKERRQAANSKIQQAHLTYQDLRAKLTAGVTEAHEASRSGREQIRFAEDQVKEAREAHRRSDLRFKPPRVPNSTPGEVLLSLQALGMAQINYLTALREYDKAQLRLLVLTGTAGQPATAHPH